MAGRGRFANAMTAKSPYREFVAATSPTPDQTESSETLREAFMKRISGNPRFQEAKESGKAFVITGHRPSPPSKSLNLR